MPRKMIETIRNEHVFVDVKRRRDSLGKYVSDVIVGVGAVIEFRPIGSLPLLCLHCTLSIRRMENKTLELHLPDTLDCRSGFESHIPVGLVGIGEFNEPHFRIEVRSYFPP